MARTGEVEANLLALNEVARLPYVSDLVARKLAGPEQSRLPDADLEFHHAEYQRLRAMLEEARDTSPLPEGPSATKELDALLVRLRLGDVQRAAR